MKRYSAMHGQHSRASRSYFLLFVCFGFLAAPQNLSWASPLPGPFAEAAGTGAQFIPPDGATRVASGEYRIFAPENSGGVGPFAAQVYDFREYWTLWRLPGGEFLAEGEQEFDSPRDVHHSNRFEVQLARDLRIRALKDYAKLRWRPDSGPLSCIFHPQQLVCTSGAKNPRNEAGLNLAMKHPYGFLWPISAFSISNITRAIEPSEGNANPVQLVTIEEPSPDNPVLPTVLDGRLRYLGKEEVTLAGQKWMARKFSLKVPFTPRLLIWTTSKGLLLLFSSENATNTVPAEGMKLVRYQQWADY